MERIRVYVADDHPLFLEGLVNAIRSRPDLELIGTAADGRTALADIKRLEPAVAVLDERMPGLSGTQVLDAVSASRPELSTRVVVLSGYSDSPLVYRAMAAGGGGYLSKELKRDAICDAVAAVARGETTLSPAAQGQLASEIRTRQDEEAPSLSGREQEVLELMAGGLSAREIAERLYLGTATIKTHQQKLYQKLGVSERAAAVAEAMRRGLLV